MSRIFFLLFFVFAIFCTSQNDSTFIRRLYDFHLTEASTYESLRSLCKEVGGRLAGSSAADKSVEWAKKKMYEAGADTVYLVPCKVPYWERGAKEKCFYSDPVTKKNITLSVCALGGSVATPVKGINAQVIEVSSFDELKSLGAEKVKGKIVFYNVKMDQRNIRTGTSYGQSVKYRYSGASEAAKLGAVASITQSMSTIENDSPHTGVMAYDTTVAKIPTCAISPVAAEKLSKQIKNKPGTTLSLIMNCKTNPDKDSYSVVGEIRGTKKPNEFIVVGGHLDSWDTGEGAHDDGAGVVHSIAVLEAFKKTNYKPNNSIRAIAFMNEENGTRGGKAYAEWAKGKNEKHILALESDAGGFTPRAIGVDGGVDTLNYFKSFEKYFEPYDVRIKKGGGGADIDFLQAQGTIMCGFEPDSQRYFDLHHTPDDVFENVNKRELNLGAAAISAFIYLVDQKGVMKK